MHWFFPPFLKMIQSLRKLCEEPDCTFSANCVVWTATWVLTPINVVSSPLPSFLLYFLFFCNMSSEKISVPAFSLFPSISFKNSSSHVLLFSFENVLPLTLTIWQNHAVFFMEGSSFFLDFWESFVSFFSIIFFKNSSVLKKWISFDFFCVFLCYKFFFRPFFITSCFCSSRFAFTSFFIPFIVWPFIFLISFFLNSFFFSFTFFDFFEQQVPFLFAAKTLQLFTFCMHALPLYVLLLFIDLFICCLFFLFLLSLSMRNTYLTLLHFRKLFTFLWDLCFFFQFFLFCVYSLVFLDILLFCSLSWTSVFRVFLFLLSFLNVSFFFENSLWFDYLFSALFFFSTTTFFTELFPCLLSPFFEKGPFSFFLFFHFIRENFVIENLCWLILKLPILNSWHSPPPIQHFPF